MRRTAGGDIRGLSWLCAEALTNRVGVLGTGVTVVGGGRLLGVAADVLWQRGAWPGHMVVAAA